MAERKTATGIKLSEVDESYQAPDNASPEEVTKARYAAAMREGVKREKGRQEPARAAALDAQAAAHKAELDRTGKIVSRAAHRDGMLWGVLLGGALIAGVIGFTWLIVTQVVIMNTATQRVNYPNPPTLQEPESATSYPRVNPREPGDAP